MAEYHITFTQYYTYYVEADSEDEAFEIAHDDFKADMRSSIANTVYDEVEVMRVE